MSHDTNISFQCECGCKKIVHTVTNVMVVSEVTAVMDIDSDKPSTRIEASNTMGGQFVGYCCEECSQLIAKDVQGLIAAGVVGEWRFVDESCVGCNSPINAGEVSCSVCKDIAIQRATVEKINKNERRQP